MKEDIKTYGTLDILNQDDTYSMLLMLLYASTDNPKYSTLSELSYILDHDSFINFIKYYEGQTIKIPSLQTIKDNIRTLLLFQFYKVDKLPWRVALEKSGFTEDESIKARYAMMGFMSQIEKHNYRIGGLIKRVNKDK